MNTWEIKGHTIEYLEEEHIYLADGIILPSITQILKYKFKDKYKDVPEFVLKRAAELGTYMHEAIQNYEETGYEVELEELEGYKKLKEQYKWECIENEVPIVLFLNNEPVACGRLDMHYKINKHGLMDFKRTSKLDTEYLEYQLNLYRIAFQQCYDIPIEELKGCHLRNKKHEIVEININEEKALELVKEWLNGKVYNAE